MSKTNVMIESFYFSGLFVIFDLGDSEKLKSECRKNLFYYPKIKFVVVWFWRMVVDIWVILSVTRNQLPVRLFLIPEWLATRKL